MSAKKAPKKKQIQIQPWSVVVPKFVHFDICKVSNKESRVMLLVGLCDVVGDLTKDECFVMPLAMVFATAQEAFEWIETAGRYLLPCDYDSRVFVFSKGEIVCTWLIEPPLEIN